METTTDEFLPISQVIGYMLKVMKHHKKKITNFKDEFNAIRHGDYDDFLARIKEPVQELLFQWKDGIIKSENFSQQSGDSDITMHYAIERSLRKFFVDCYSYYGEINDVDISNLMYCKCAAFEIALRVQCNKERQNRNITYSNADLIDIVDELCVHNNITTEEKEVLHNGRKFINMLKLNKLICIIA